MQTMSRAAIQERPARAPVASSAPPMTASAPTPALMAARAIRSVAPTASG